MEQVSKLDILDKIFGGAGKVKIMRLFLFNPTENFDANDIARRSKIDIAKVRQIVGKLEKIGMVKKRTFYKEAKAKGAKKRKTKGWILNENFTYTIPLKNMLVNLKPCRGKDIKEKFAHTGKIKLIIIAGLFIQEWESRLDILIVGDGLKKGSVETVLRTLEAEVGRELKYAVFDTNEFRYRLSVFDKLVRDILDYPHEIVVDRLDPPLSSY